MLAFRPSIRRDALPAWDATLPLKPWDLRSGGVGGSSVSAAGVPESFEVRRDRIARVPIWVLEEELEELMLVLEEIRESSEAFTFAFDQDDEYSTFDVYLHAPVWPADIEPDRDEEYLGRFLVTIEIRTVDGSGFGAVAWVLTE